MKVTALIAVRTGSSRLPAKALLPVAGKPMLERLIERVGRAKAIDEIVIATTTLPADDRLEELAGRLGTGCFRGSADDVLGRMAGAVARSAPDLVVELLGDNPLIHADLIEDVVAFHRDGGFDYAVNVTHEQPHAPADAARWPIGIRVEVYTPDVIARCAAETDDPYHREHSTSYIAQHPDQFKLGYFPATGNWAALHHPGLTFAVNYRENLELIQRLFESCLPEDENFSLQVAMAAFSSRPELAPLMGVHE